MAIQRVDILPRPHVFTAEEYLAFEERSEFKHEFIDGVIYDWGDVDPDAPVHPDYVPGYPMPHLFTVEEYLAFEAESETRHEFIDGVIYDMTGGTLYHSRIKIKLIRVLLSQLDEERFELLNSDMRVQVRGAKFVYPDLSVTYSDAQFADDDMTLFNPILVVEVTSPSALGYDRGAKADYYRALPSVEAYLIIDQREPFVDLHTRTEAGWRWQAFSDIDAVIPLDMIGCELPLGAVYRGIDFEAA